MAVAAEAVERAQQLLAGGGPVALLGLDADEEAGLGVALEVVAEAELGVGVGRGDVEVVDAAGERALDGAVGDVLGHSADGVGAEGDDGAGVAGLAKAAGFHCPAPPSRPAAAPNTADVARSMLASSNHRANGRRYSTA